LPFKAQPTTARGGHRLAGCWKLRLSDEPRCAPLDDPLQP
jgi:hypothetical protein